MSFVTLREEKTRKFALKMLSNVFFEVKIRFGTTWARGDQSSKFKSSGQNSKIYQNLVKFRFATQTQQNKFIFWDRLRLLWLHEKMPLQKVVLKNLKWKFSIWGNNSNDPSILGFIWISRISSDRASFQTNFLIIFIKEIRDIHWT